MTRRHFLPIAALIALASCNGKKADNTTDSSASSAAEAQEPTKELIEKEIFVGSQFSYITNLSSIKIVYTLSHLGHSRQHHAQPSTAAV